MQEEFPSPMVHILLANRTIALSGGKLDQHRACKTHTLSETDDSLCSADVCCGTKEKRVCQIPCPGKYGVGSEAHWR